MNNLCGVYEIENSLSMKRYVGSSVNIENRWRRHKTDLRKNRHHSQYLQRAWNKYGENSFAFNVLVVCERRFLQEYEQWYLDNKNCEYNVSDNVESPTRGKHISAEHIEALRKANLGNQYTLGYNHTEESKEQISANNAKYWNGKSRSNQTKELISKALKGRPLTEETKRKMSEARMGHIVSEETRGKIGASHRGEKNINYGKKLPKSTTDKMAISQKKRWERINEEKKCH